MPSAVGLAACFDLGLAVALATLTIDGPWSRVGKRRAGVRVAAEVYGQVRLAGKVSRVAMELAGTWQYGTTGVLSVIR